MFTGNHLQFIRIFPDRCLAQVVLNSNRMKTKNIRMLTVLYVVVALWLGMAPSVLATPVSLGGAANYAVLGEGGSVNFSDFEVYQSGTVVNGNIGMGPHSDLTHNIDATIHGNFDYDTTSTLAGKTTTGVQGSVNQINMSGIVADARTASATAAAFAPNQTFSTLTENQVITGVIGLNVIRITGDVSLKIGLTINGSAGSSFIFQFTSTTTDGHDILNLSGMTMTLTGGVTADNLLWDLNGIGNLGGININAGSVVYGTFLAPDRDILGDHAILDGRLIGGGSGNQVSVHSSSQITSPGTNVPDASSTAMLMGLAVGCLALARAYLKVDRRATS
jgi:hypothetical protein